MTEILAAIDAPHFYAGIVLQDGVVVEAAPIVKYMAKKKWTRAKVRDYCREQGWTITVVWEMARPAAGTGSCSSCAG